MLWGTARVRHPHVQGLYTVHCACQGAQLPRQPCAEAPPGGGGRATHRALPLPLPLPPPLTDPFASPLPPPFAPPYLGPFSEARRTQLEIQSDVLANFGRAAPMHSKYAAQSRMECFRSRQRAWSSSSLAGSLQLVASMCCTVSATSPMTTSTTIIWNIRISRETLVASKTAAASGLVLERCHHITQRSELSSEYASTNSRRFGQAGSSCSTVYCTSNAPMSGQRSLCRNDSSVTKLDSASPTFLRREFRVSTSHRKVRQKLHRASNSAIASLFAASGFIISTTIWLMRRGNTSRMASSRSVTS